MQDIAIRQIVWNATLAELDGWVPDAHEVATKIADRFTAECVSRRSSRHVSETTRAAIKSDLIVGYWSYAEIRARHDVGTSTVQRIAKELRAQGVTVHTVGSRHGGRRFPRVTSSR